jgi:hypothetical protein
MFACSANKINNWAIMGWREGPSYRLLLHNALFKWQTKSFLKTTMEKKYRKQNKIMGGDKHECSSSLISK